MDIFVDGCELLLQSKINPVIKSKEFIINLLKSNVNKIEFENINDVRYNFFINNKEIYSIGDYKLINIIKRKKIKKIIEFTPWIKLSTEGEQGNVPKNHF